MIQFLGYSLLTLAIMLLISIIINVITISMLKNRKKNEIIQDNLISERNQKMMKKLEENKEVYDEKIKDANNTNDLGGILDDLLSNSRSN